MSKILDEPYLYGSVYYNGYHTESNRIENTLDAVADFICRKGMECNILITTPMDEFVLNTFGSFINQCPDKEYLEELKKVLIPRQMNIDGSLNRDISRSVLFSKVELWTDNEKEFEFFVGGIPRAYDDFEFVTEFNEFIDLESKPQAYQVCVSSYVYGEGETKKANKEQLAEIKENFENDTEWMSELSLTENSEFTINGGVIELLGDELNLMEGMNM